MSPTHPVPLIYRLLFTYLDPFFCIIGLLTHLLPTLTRTTLTGYSTTFQPNDPIPVSTTHLLESMAGFFALLGTLEAVLLRVRGRDVTVWRVVQGCASLLDLAMVYAAVGAMRSEGRWRGVDVDGWRGDDWRLVVGNAVFGVVRVGCAVGVGMGSGVEGGVKKRV